jgi:hypothetical protein
MAHDEEVEDLEDLESTVPLAVGARAGVEDSSAPPIDAGKGPVEASVPTSEDTSWRARQLPKSRRRRPALRRWRSSARGVGCRILFL